MASHVTHAASIIQLACQDISLADEVERAMAFAQVAEGRLQVDQDVDCRAKSLLTSRETTYRGQRLFEEDDGLTSRHPPDRIVACPPEVEVRFLPHLRLSVVGSQRAHVRLEVRAMDL